MSKPCNDCNNPTDGKCCHESIMTDNKTERHIVTPADEHLHQHADNHASMMFGALVSTKQRDSFFEHKNIGNC